MRSRSPSFVVQWVCFKDCRRRPACLSRGWARCRPPSLSQAQAGAGALLQAGWAHPIRARGDGLQGSLTSPQGRVYQQPCIVDTRPNKSETHIAETRPNKSRAHICRNRAKQIRPGTTSKEQGRHLSATHLAETRPTHGDFGLALGGPHSWTLVTTGDGLLQEE